MCNGMASLVAVGLDLGGHWVGALRVPARARVVRKSILSLKIRVNLHKICVCSGVWKGKKEMDIFKTPKGTLKISRIQS